MNLTLKAIILGVVEGVTEFLPVSSTGHLILTGHALEFPAPFSSTFEIAIQAGAILAVVFLNIGFFKQFINPKRWISRDALVIIVGCLPAALLGVLVHKWIKLLLFNPTGVAIALIAGGFLMMYTQFRVPPGREVEPAHLSYKQALTVGLFQCLSLWPGMSRSASSMIGGLWSGLDYKSSARYSFLLAVPLILAASVFDLSSTPTLTRQSLELIAVGTLVSFGVAVVSIKLFLSLLDRLKFFPFALYRIGLGVLILSLEILT